MSKENDLIACYNGVFSNSIFKLKSDDQNQNFVFETEEVNGDEYLIFNDQTEIISDENRTYEYSFTKAIDSVFNEKLLDKEKIDALRKYASELNNILIQKNDYDTREKIFKTVSKARIAYVNLMGVLRGISDDLKQINLDQTDINNNNLKNDRSYRFYMWLYDSFIFTWLAQIIELFSDFGIARKLDRQKNNLNNKEIIETLIDHQLGILMTNKIFFVDLGSRLCDALEHGDKFEDVSLDYILRNPTENTKVYYIDQKPDDLKKLGNGAVNTTYLFDDDNKVLKFGNIFLDPLGLKLRDELSASDATLYQEKNMENITENLIGAQTNEISTAIKNLSDDVCDVTESEVLHEFFAKLTDSDPENKLFLKRVLFCICNLDDMNDRGIIDEFCKKAIKLECGSESEDDSEKRDIRDELKGSYREIADYIANEEIRDAMQKIKLIMIESNYKYGVLVNTAFRANISYELASMLGFNAIVKTQTGVSPKDYISIMDKINGKSFFDYFVPQEGVTIEVTKDYIESVMELMVIDYLLDQSDRHSNNYFFDYVTKTVVGIDNDFILATSEQQKEKLDKYNNLPTKLPVVTERIKESILNFDDKDFEGLLNFSLVDKKSAIDRAKKRLAGLKTYVQTVEVLDINENRDKIVSKFVEPVRQFITENKEKMGANQSRLKRLFANPIFSNVDTYKNNIRVIKNASKKKHVAHANKSDAPRIDASEDEKTSDCRT